MSATPPSEPSENTPSPLTEGHAERDTTLSHVRVQFDGAFRQLQCFLFPLIVPFRLPRLIGVRAALDMILAGKQVPARRAYRMGIVDETVLPQ